MPLLIYDGKCAFCRSWIDYWRQLTGDSVRYATSQDVATDYPQIPPERFGRSVQLVLDDGSVLEGAHAVFRSLSTAQPHAWLVTAYHQVPGFATVSEAAYRLVAAHRDFGYWATVLLFGRQLRPLRYDRLTWIFQRALAAIFLIAFLSFGAQAMGLIGSRGVLPVSLFFTRAENALGSRAWLAVPSLLWWNSSDAAIQAVWIAGAICAVLALIDRFTRAAFAGAWLLYLSLVSASQDFLSFQWDILLLETGFLIIFAGYSRVIIWLYRWLLFRLMFLSGAVKLLSGDPTWRGLEAMSVHFQTQPIPTPLAWYAHQLPRWFQQFSTGAVFFIELLIPLLILGPRRARLFAAPWLIGLQMLILLTGNYAFFNWLTLALCLFLFDDELVHRRMPGSVNYVRKPRVAWAAASLIGVVSGSMFWQTMVGRPIPFTGSLVSLAAPFGIASSYGLFATMTTLRPEIILEGSNDGTNWREYEFRYKAGQLDRKPPWVAPHQPRLDWQMWFAAFSSYQENIWLLNLMARVLQGSPEPLALLGGNPFPDAPPKFVRAQLYDYRFTTVGSQHWWTRRYLGPYVPPITLQDLSTLPILQGR
jgi:predicted DCC family thiol-disulfide oxidoreductase YuxK